MIAVRFLQGSVVAAAVAALCAAAVHPPAGPRASYTGEIASDKVGKGGALASAGDVNNDGYDDFIIGSQDNDDGGGKAGKVYLIFGKATGWADDVALSGADASFIGELDNDKAGTAIAGIGDVNNDGFDDIAIGAPQAGGGSKAGAVYLIFGKAAGWATNIDLSTADASFVGEVDDEKAGAAIAGVGDVNTDGYDDFIIGVPNNGDGGGKAGKVYLILGKAAGWATGTNLSTADASFIGEAGNDKAGTAIAGIGDVNNDGFDDIAIGAPQAGGGSKAGAVYLVFGKAAGWATGIDLSTADASFVGEVDDEKAGTAIAGVGDVNNDAYDDFIIGVPNNGDGGGKAGKVYLILGKAAGWATGTNLSTADASFIGEVGNDKAGTRVAGAGDVNNDGFADFLIGAPDNDDAGGGAGKVYLILGKSAGWTTGTDLALADASYLGEVAGDDFGEGLYAAGDLNNDTKADFVVASPQDDTAGADTGKVYVFLGTWIITSWKEVEPN